MSYTYKIRIEGNSESDVKIAGVENESKVPVRRFVTSTSAGEFSWDGNGEYGPFGSFYAAFDDEGSMVCHLNARNLSYSVSGTKVIDSGGLVRADGTRSRRFNVMWVVPRMYVSVMGDDLVLCSDNHLGGVAYAHTVVVNGKSMEYPYLAYGVYESCEEGGKTWSMPGRSPAVSKSVTDFGEMSCAHKISCGLSMQWNWWQWNLLRYCTFAALGTFNSQSFARGVVDLSPSNKPLTTGLTARATDGYFSRPGGEMSERLFVENAWGNTWALLSNTFFMNDGLYASRSPVTQASPSGEGMSRVHEDQYDQAYTADPCRIRTDRDVWGLPDFKSSGSPLGLFDYAYVRGSDRPVARVGGCLYRGSGVGISNISAHWAARSHDDVTGSRLVMLFGVGTPVAAAPKELSPSVKMESDFSKLVAVVPVNRLSDRCDLVDDILAEIGTEPKVRVVLGALLRLQPGFLSKVMSCSEDEAVSMSQRAAPDTGVDGDLLVAMVLALRHAACR